MTVPLLGATADWYCPSGTWTQVFEDTFDGPGLPRSGNDALR